jgi:hypothetical protein
MNVTAQKTARVNKVVNAKTTTKVTNVIKPDAKPKVEKITYLAIGVTGKQMMKAIYDANNKHKQDLGTFSQCLKRAIEFGKDELTQTIKGFDVKDCTPKNLIPLRNVKRGVDAKFSVYEVLMLIKKFYQTK